MNNERDLILQQLFADTYAPLPVDEFTIKVMQRTRALKIRAYVLWGLAAVIAVFAAWYLYSGFVLQLTNFITHALSIELVVFDSDWVRWVLTPINTLGGLLALTYTVVRRFRRRVTCIGYAG